MDGACDQEHEVPALPNTKYFSKIDKFCGGIIPVAAIVADYFELIWLVLNFINEVKKLPIFVDFQVGRSFFFTVN